MKSLQTLKITLLFSNIIFFAIACTPKTEIKILRPAEVQTENIKKVAVASFEIEEIQQISYQDRDGIWRTKPVKLSKKDKSALSKLIRAKVINLFNTVPYFQLVYSDKFAELKNDKDVQKMIAAQGFKTDQVDAIISGKVWINFNRYDSADIDDDEIEFNGNGVELEMDRVLWYPFKSLRGTIVVETKLVRTNPTEIIAVSLDKRSFAQKIEGNDSSFSGDLDVASQLLKQDEDDDEKEEKENEEDDLYLPPFEQVMSEVANSVAANFAKRVAVTQTTASYPIAEGGDQAAQLLIEKGAYKKAIERLGSLISSSEEKNIDNIYNLGLCYEALGEYGIAMITYEDAFEIEKGNELVIAGLGRIEEKKQQQRILSKQLDK